MEFNNLEKQVGEFGIKVGFLNKNLYKIFAPKIPDTERILFAAEGLSTKSGNKVPVIVTNTNVYIISYASVLGGLSINTINRSKISSVSSSGTFLANITINEGTVVYLIEGLRRDLAESLCSMISSPIKVETNESTKQTSSADEIRKYKSLFDDGIINQEEFDKKKKELLGIVLTRT